MNSSDLAIASTGRVVERLSLVAALLIVGAAGPTAWGQSMTFLNRVDTLRGPEDVALVPSGGIAVVRCVDRPNTPPAQASADEIFVIKTGGTPPGLRATVNVLPGASYHGLTPSTGASDLVAVTPVRAVLIGQNHDGPESGWRTLVDILDISGTYGTTSYGLPGPQFLKSFDFAGSGGANDVAITGDGAWAVVNSRNRIDVFDLDADAPSGTIPVPVLALTVPTGPTDPSFLRDSIVMTRDIGGASKAVVLTKRISGNVGRAVVYVVTFSLSSPPTVGPALELDAGNPGVDHTPHDIELSPDDRLALITAKDAIGLVDINAGALVTETASQPGTLREYDNMIDSVALSSTQAVVIGKTPIVPPSSEFGWQVDVFDIAPLPTGLTLRQSFSSPSGGFPHDLAMGPAGDVAAVRTLQHVVVLQGIDQAGGPVTKTEIASPSKLLLRNFNNNSDTVVVTPSWLTFALPGGGGPPGGVVQYAVVLADDPNSSPNGTRVDIINLKNSTLGIDHTELLYDPVWNNPGVIPGKVQIARSGRAVLVHSRAQPDTLTQAQQQFPSYDQSTGEDVAYISLNYPIGLVSKYEGWGHLEAASDSFAVERTVAVFISNLVPGNTGYIQTMAIQ